MAEALERLADITAVLDRSRTAALNRKLVKEIEQALKKIYDGINNFKELGVKMEAAEVRACSACQCLISYEMLMSSLTE